MVFAPNEGDALRRLETLFSRLGAHRLKLTPKKCHLLYQSVKFLGHFIDENGYSTDPEKGQAIVAMSEEALMGDDGVTPSQKRLNSFLGMVMYYLTDVLLKSALLESVVLAHPDFNRPFQLMRL